MGEKNILLDINNYVATITLNRIEKHNALTGRMMDQFVLICNELNENPDVRVIILTGAGNKAFCTGADLGAMSSQNDKHIIEYKKHITKYRDCLLAIHRLRKPIIAAVNGYALAGGLGLAAASDITFANDKAQFGAPEINVGLWGMQISAPLIQTIGYKKTYELFYTGERIDSYRAKEIGLVNEVFANDEFNSEVEKFANKLAMKNPTAISLGRESIQMIQGMEYEKALSYLRDQVLILGETEDSKEGMKAFLEKREPIWSGR